jgi:glucosamine-6-phosphate deaminase
MQYKKGLNWNMRIEIHNDVSELGKALACKIVDQMLAAQSERRRYLLGCPGGRSPKPVYAELATMAINFDLDLSNVTLVMMDDYLEGNAPPFRYVDINAHYSCRRFAIVEIAAVLNRGKPPAKQIQPENIWYPDPENCEFYDERIADAGGIDLFILASGATDGHIAFNPPGSPRCCKSRIVRLAQQTRSDNLKTFPDFTSLSEVPKFGVTIGVGSIAKHSKSAAMVVFGADKKLAFQEISQASVYSPDWPASIITECSDAILYADVVASDRSLE